jgi:5-methyltetrahydrofolate--homocysteine methyltransferase
MKKDFDARLQKMTKDALKDGWLKPQAVYGFFPCQSDGDDLLIYDPQSPLINYQLLTRFHFPRQPYDDHLALSDYYASVESGQLDVVALQVVTVGLEATKRFEKMQAANDYTEAYFTHGLAVQTAEATANYLHEHIRRELGLGEEQGKRYSWGYPAIPELEDHKKVFELLPAVTSELGMTLSSAYQLIPEQSTAAIIVHHKDAKYYTVGESRVEQLMR